jgi:hypothetical protein
MGLGGSTEKSVSYSSTSIVSDAMLAVVQDIHQGVNADEVISVRCDGTQCQDCISNIKKIFPNSSPSQTKSACFPICSCVIDGINMSEQISVNFQAFQTQSGQADFVAQIKNALTLRAKQQGGDIFTAPDREKATTDTALRIHQYISENMIEKITQAFAASQVLELTGPGKITNASLAGAKKVLQTSIESETGLADDLTQLTENIIALTTEVTNAGLAEVIKWIVRIVLIIVLVMAIGFGGSYVTEFWSLEAR